MASSEPARGNDCRKLVNRSRLTSFRGRLLESPRRSTSWLGSSVIRPRLAMQPSSPTRGSRRSKMTSSTRRSPRPPSGSDSRPSPWRRPILTWKSFSPVRDPPCSSFPVQAHHDFWCSFAEPEEASRIQHCHKTLPNNKLAPSSAATHRGCVPRFVEKERRPPLRHQGIRSGGNLRVFENLAQTLVAVDAP